MSSPITSCSAAPGVKTTVGMPAASSARTSWRSSRAECLRAAA